MGLGALCLCADVAVMCYFERFRGVAFGIAAAGDGLGFIVIPILFSSLSRYFGTDVGWRSAVLVYSIIVTVITFLGSLTFRPLEIETPTDKEVEENEETNAGKDSEAKDDDNLKTLAAKLQVKTTAATSLEMIVPSSWISEGHLEGKEISVYFSN
ncbi:hypothetical protein Aperf_G00000038473 [Anoplocephala perfoliata]